MRAAFPTPRLSARTFDQAAANTLFLLVRVEPGLTSLHAGVARFFDRQYPGLFGFGTLSARDTRAPGWWDRTFRTAVGQVFRASRTGYFLFHEAVIVGHHSGIIRTDLTFSDRRAHAEHSRGQAELAWVREVAFDNAVVPSLELAAAFELIAYFDGIVGTCQARAGFADEERRSTRSGGRTGGVTPQKVAIPGASGDPFEILKIPETATDAEIRAAYKLAMKLNHPDKVGHMSIEIQDYAHAQVRAIKAAYEAIASARGKG